MPEFTLSKKPAVTAHDIDIDIDVSMVRAAQPAAVSTVPELLPAAGGSFIRNPKTGELTPNQE